MITRKYEPLSSKSVAERLGAIEAIRVRTGDPSAWTVREVGDGNLNLVFIIDGPAGSVIVKQALPYVRLVGEGWPLPLKRTFFEYNALVRHAARDPGSVPEVFYFDEEQALLVMEYLSPHVILRHSLMAGKRYANLGDVLGRFCARTLFRGSDLSMKTADRKADLALFAGNVELCDITENLVFSDPYFASEMNSHTPQLDPIVADLRADIDLKIAAQHLKSTFATNAETMLHGDLHTGSLMVSDTETRVIDPEFATYGPMGFDIGMLIANFLMAYFAQPGHAETEGSRAEYQEWILSVVDEIWSEFYIEFTRLWREERNGILYERKLFEDQGHDLGAEQARLDRLAAIWRDTLGFCGIEMHRRTLGLAHIAEYDQIADDSLRAQCEARGLRLGRVLAVRRGMITSMDEVLDLTRHINEETII